MVFHSHLTCAQLCLKNILRIAIASKMLAQFWAIFCWQPRQRLVQFTIACCGFSQMQPPQVADGIGSQLFDDFLSIVARHKRI